MSGNLLFKVRSLDIEKENQKPDFRVCGNQVYSVS